MAETKPKKAADKLFDVAKPGKSAPSPTSRPVIITNRPVLKDPMVIRVDTGDDEDSTATTADTSTEMKHKVDIKPLHIDLESVLAPSASEVKKTSKKAAAAKAADEQPAETETPVAEETPAEESVTVTKTPKADATETSPEPTPEVATDDAPVEAPAEAKPAEPVQRVREKVIAPPSATADDTKAADEQPAETETPAPAETTGESESKPVEDSIGDDEPSLDNSDKPVLSEKETKAAEAAKQRAEEQEKIIASGQFYLPINAVSKRRTKRNIAIGTFLVIVLIVAAALAAWDAGLFSIPGFTAPTNFL